MKPPHWIQTYTGKAFDLDNPQPDQICIEDIAHALSNCCRYAGHSRYHYSVAQHSLLVSDIVRKTDPALALTALLHDAAEVYIGDWSSPLKALMRAGRRPGEWSPLDIEVALEAAIGKRFGVDLVTRNPVIKHADLVALVTEKRDLFGPSPRPGWGDATGYVMPEPLNRSIRYMSPPEAELAFFDAFRWGYGIGVK